MSGNNNTIVSKATHIVHKYFLPSLISSYVFAALQPQVGLSLRQITLGSVSLPGLGQINYSVPLLMLSFLLFNAGVGIKAKELIGIIHRPLILIVGFLANIFVPILLVFSLRILLGCWPDSEELHSLLAGLALIIAMPIAGSSTAWSQNANGNLSLSLGLVLLSTFLSPLTTPLVLHFFGSITMGDYAEDLHELAGHGTDAFLLTTVVLPAIGGIVTRYVLGEQRIDRLKHYLKFSNFMVLLLLNYSNASTSLPQAFRNHDYDYLALILVLTGTVCIVAFSSGWLVSLIFKADKSDKAALMFSLGMNNNGTGLVLAAGALSDHAAVTLPIIFYTLIQQVVAAFIDWRIFKSED